VIAGVSVRSIGLERRKRFWLPADDWNAKTQRRQEEWKKLMASLMNFRQAQRAIAPRCGGTLWCRLSPAITSQTEAGLPKRLEHVSAASPSP
jgi:hypothetical protein